MEVAVEAYGEMLRSEGEEMQAEKGGGEGSWQVVEQSSGTGHGWRERVAGDVLWEGREGEEL